MPGAIFADALPGRLDFKPEVALISPLWRTLQTATEAMAARSDGHTCPMVAFEEVREHNNFNACNHRRPIQRAHRTTFASVDFSGISVDGPTSGAEWVHGAACFALVTSGRRGVAPRRQKRPVFP